jgi:hypothetical protein
MRLFYISNVIIRVLAALTMSHFIRRYTSYAFNALLLLSSDEHCAVENKTVTT